MVNIDGLVTGLDTESIVAGLLDVQQRQISLLESRQAEISLQQTAFKAVEASIVGLQSSLGRLSQVQNNVFDRRTAQVGDESALIVTAGSKAALGTYQVTINSLAQAHQVASNGFSDADAEITQGTLSIQIGNGAATTITVDSTNNTLRGLAETITREVEGVTASVVTDANGEARLLVGSNETGVDNALTITNNLAADNGNAVQPTFDFNNPVQSAQDAVVVLGSGTGAISVKSSTNEVDGLISGVKLNLLQADAGKTISVTIGRNNEAATEAVQDFIDAYNGLISNIDSSVRYDADSEAAGPLQGVRTVTSIQQKIRASVLDTVPGLKSTINRLSAIGVSVSETGSLSLNSTRLQDVLEGRVEGVTARDVKRLFTLDGTSDSAGVEFVLGSNRTQAPTNPITVHITQAAERGTILGHNALASSITIDSSNESLTVALDGVTTELTLAHGTYTRDELAAHLETQINSNAEFGSREVNVRLESDKIRLTSASYGSSSTVAVTGGTFLTDLGFNGAETGTGKDVVGHFVVDGKVEQAKGSGRLLIGDSENDTTADLQLRITLSSTQVGSGHDSQLTLTRGVASRLDQTISQLLDEESGQIKTVNDGFDARIEDIQESIDRQNALFAIQEEKLLQQFAALESLIGELQNTSSFLASQLGALAAPGQ